MSEVIRNVRDIETGDRQALEHLLGVRLEEDQKLVISVRNINDRQLSAEVALPADTPTPNATLPQWCNVYDGLSEDEVAEIEKSIVRTPGSRRFP